MKLLKIIVGSVYKPTVMKFQKKICNACGEEFFPEQIIANNKPSVNYLLTDNNLLVCSQECANKFDL